MNRWASVALLVAALAGCSSDSPRASTFVGSVGDLPLAVETPTTIVGLLEVSVEEGPVGDDDISEINFGTVEVEAGYVLVEIPGDVVREAGLTWDDLHRPARYEISLIGSGDVVAGEEIPSYAVDGLTALD